VQCVSEPKKTISSTVYKNGINLMFDVIHYLNNYKITV